MKDNWTVGQLAAEFAVTVRTLHHYDEIGLLRPSGRSRSDYRLYARPDVERLASIVGYRRLGFALEEIAELLDDADIAGHLKRQREALVTRIDELSEQVAAIDTALEKIMDNAATDDDLRRLFGDGYADARAEAEQRWGDTDSWRESARRTSSYTTADWERIKAEGGAVSADFAAAFAAGEPADGDVAAAIAERHREHIDRWFYPLSYTAQRGLAAMYVEDARFRANYDDAFEAPGLAEYIRSAVDANADRHA